MTGKKIEFLKKPTIKSNSQIDAWVIGDSGLKEEEKKLKRTTIYLPEEIHKRLKIEAANRETSMTELIIEAIEKYV